jgi:hypothetical protein
MQTSHTVDNDPPDGSKPKTLFGNWAALTIMIFSDLTLLLLIVITWFNLAPDAGTGVTVNNINILPTLKNDN